MSFSICNRGVASLVLLGCTLVMGITCSAGAQTLINGAGATFPAPIYQKWFSDYQSIDRSIQINYQAIGSGGGIRQVTEGTVDFGASDGPMSDKQLRTYREKQGFDILHFPTVLGAAVPTYNVPGISATLNFTPEAVAGIFLGKITKWNDPAIQSANPKVKLPDLEIIVVHRSDGSGTTYCWTEYLTKVSPEWARRVGKNTSVKWPLGIGGKGNEGVLGLIRLTPGAVGYVELTYATKNQLPFGRLKNSSGEFVKADMKSLIAAAASIGSNMPYDFRMSITNPPGSGAYPASTFTWLLVPSHIPDASKREALKRFLKWALTTGQSLTASLGYGPLPVSMRKKEIAAIEKIN